MFEGLVRPEHLNILDHHHLVSGFCEHTILGRGQNEECDESDESDEIDESDEMDESDEINDANDAVMIMLGSVHIITLLKLKVNMVMTMVMMISISVFHLDNFLNSLLVALGEEGDGLGSSQGSVQEALPGGILS